MLYLIINVNLSLFMNYFVSTMLIYLLLYQFLLKLHCLLLLFRLHLHAHDDLFILLHILDLFCSFSLQICFTLFGHTHDLVYRVSALLKQTLKLGFSFLIHGFIIYLVLLILLICLLVITLLLVMYWAFNVHQWY